MNSYPEEIQEFIRSHSRDYGYIRMTQLINETFGTDYTKGQIHGYYRMHGIKSECTGRFEPGHIPDKPYQKGKRHPNSVATQFKAGSVPKNTDPVGTITQRWGGYYWKKTGMPNTWKQMHILLWEAENGPIPEGHCLMFLDGDRTNYQLENLKLISRRENAIMNQKHLRAHSTELNEAALATAKVIARIKDYEKGKK